MFKRSESDKRRVIIVDVLHLAYKAAYGGMPALNATLMSDDGNLVMVNTQITTFIAKQIHRWSNGGTYPVVACFDSIGSNRCRKAYFASRRGILVENPSESDASTGTYKEGRATQGDKFYESVNMTLRLLHTGGVVCLSATGYEADDLVKAAVDKAKETYPDLPIDVITGDTDLLPLVDDQVSVFHMSRRATYAELEDIKKNHYYQVTPRNYEEYVNGISSFKNLVTPYNTVLLAKLLRGDKSDNIPGYPKFTPTKYKNLIAAMQEDDVPLGEIFRYDTPIRHILNKDTGEEVSIDDDCPNKCVEFEEPPCLTRIRETLSKYLDEDIVRHCVEVYNGINLNGVFHDGLPELFWRQPANITSPIKGYSAFELQSVLSKLRINLPMF